MDNNDSEENGKTRVLLVIRWPVGGIRTFIHYVYTNFDRKRYQITIVAPQTPELKALLDDLKDYTVSFIEIPLIFTPLQLITPIIKVLKVIAHQKIDLIHTQGLSAGIISAIPAWLNKIPHVLTLHDMLNDGQFQKFGGYVKKLAISLFLLIIDEIHVASHDCKANLLDTLPFAGKLRTKTIVIPHGINIEQFSHVGQRNLREEYSIQPDVFLVGFFGRFMSPKGFSYLVDAVEVMRSNGGMTHKKLLVLSFGGGGGFYREERKKVSDKGLEEYFLFLPFIDNVASTIKGLDLVVMPSLWEACGLVAMETMVVGTPLIGTDCIGLRETLKDSPAKVVASRDSKALAEAIQIEMTNPSRAAAKDFTREASQRFDARKQARALEDMFQKHMIGKHYIGVK